MSDLLLRDLVSLAPLIASEVHLESSLWWKDAEKFAERLAHYTPTQSARQALVAMLGGSSHAQNKRVHFLTGSYGTGKSYLLLVLAALLELAPEDPRLTTLRSRIRTQEARYKDGLAKELDTADDLGGYGFLVVVPNYGDSQFGRALLTGLREALTAADITYPFKTEFAEAERILSKWEQDQPDFIERYEKLLDESISLAQLRRQLESYDPAALRTFRETYERLIGVSPSFDFVSVEETYRDVSKYLQSQQDGKYRGIAVLLDEFGFFLNEAAADISGSAVRAIQDFVEAVKAHPSANLFVVFAAHRALSDYARASVSEDVKKLEGRFQGTHHLKVASQFHEAEEMMTAALVVPSGTDAADRAAVIEEHLSLAQDEGWLREMSGWYTSAPSASWVQETLVHGGYPLHPSVLLALPLLSEAVGQNARTMFRYLDPSEVGGAGEVLSRRPARDGTGRPSLLAIDDLFDYFVGAMDGQPADGRHDAVGAYAQYRSSKAILQEMPPLADRILRAVAVISLLKDPRLQATPAKLRWALNIPEEEQDAFGRLLDRLKQQGALRQNSATHIIAFPGTSQGTSIDVLLKRHRDAVEANWSSSDLVSQLQAFAPANLQNEYAPIFHNDRNGTNRKVSSDYVTLDTVTTVVGRWEEAFKKLFSEATLDPFLISGNLLVLYGLAESIEERDRLVQRVHSTLSGKLQPYVVLAVRSEPLALRDAVLDVLGARELLGDPTISKDENARDEAVDKYSQLVDRLKQQARQAQEPRSLSWYYGEQSLELMHEPGSLEVNKRKIFLDSIFDKIYYSTPLISYIEIQHYRRNTSATKRSRSLALRTLLTDKTFTIEGTSEDVAALRGLLQNNGMFEEKNVEGHVRKGSLKTPDESSSAYKAWDRLAQLTQTQGGLSKNVELKEIVETFYRRPFGMSRGAFELLFGAYLATDRNSYTIEPHRGAVEPLTAELIQKALDAPERFRLVHQVMQPHERRYLNKVREVFTDAGIATGDVQLSPWLGASMRLIGWAKRLSPLTRKFCPNEPLRALLEVVKSVPDSPDAAQAKTLLLTTVPSMLGHDPSMLQGLEAVEDVTSYLKEAMQAANEFPEAYAEELFRDLGAEAFQKEVKGSADFLAEVQQWERGLSRTLVSNTFDSPADGLLKIVTQADSRSVTERFLSALPSQWGIGSFTSWDRIAQRIDFIKTFAASVREIKAWRESPLPALNRLYRDAFGEDVRSEHEFSEGFSMWLGSLPKETYERLNEGGFGVQATALLAAIEGGGDASVRFLQSLPQRLDPGRGVWPSWGPADLNRLSQAVSGVIKAIDGWIPPPSQEQIVETAGHEAWKLTGATLETLNARAEHWYASLRETTRRASFAGVKQVIMQTLSEGGSLSAALEASIPDAAGLMRPSKAEDEGPAHSLVQAFVRAVREIEQWRRPDDDVLVMASRQLGWDERFGPVLRAEAFALQLLEWRRTLETVPPTGRLTLLADAMVEWASNPSPWKRGFDRVIAAAGLPADPTLWTSQQDDEFAQAVKEAVAQAEAYEIPEEERIASLAASLADALRKHLKGTPVELFHDALGRALRELNLQP